MTLKYRDQIGHNTSKIIPRLISLVFLECRDHNVMDLLQREVGTLWHFGQNSDTAVIWCATCLYIVSH